MQDLIVTLRGFLKANSGATLVEYGVALIVAIVVGTTAINGLANVIGDELAETASAF